MNFVFVVNRANLYTDIWIRCQQVGQWSVPWNSCSRALHWLTEAVTNQASDALKSNIECALMRADMFSQAKVNTRPYTHTHTYFSVCQVLSCWCRRMRGYWCSAECVQQHAAQPLFYDLGSCNAELVSRDFSVAKEEQDSTPERRGGGWRRRRGRRGGGGR